MAEVEALTLTAVTIEPNECTLGSELKVSIKFKVNKAISKGVWDLMYMVDMASKRKLIPLGQSAGVSYAAGEEATVELGCPSIETAGFKPHQLANAGLVICQLKDGDEEVVAVNMVTQVTKKEDGQLYRTVYSPLEE
eukprot:CAMPEP_0173411372 /NCGR_PEP_ID=MMETSP1356-20130122/76770_1 /TAXON_ID=77927 ORGANISM="Hemiselmis virescens, Strain PCC157" /NCGR_SAMPLE_ID=MMETSP1356 /ASSEMBLY_ACC=CAM_ASM_000847 /LENGTH=136 /DNA_ID=CAMNT_0014373119 /DNA_START=58 /DNA_END=468 /DNA_ORIENTATION=+